MKRLVITITSMLLVGFAIAAPATSVSSSATVIKTAYNAKLKKTIVVDGRGRTLYLLISDSVGRPTCAELSPDCPKAWPAVTAVGAPVAGKGINGKKLGIAKGAGGVRQVTYNHHPLYTFHGGFGAPAGDTKPGQIRGQAFYGIWYVVSPKGNAIK